MSSELEKIRALALKESNRQDEEKEKITSEVRRLAKKHLPEWVKAIERVMYNCNSKKVSFFYEERPGWFFSSRYHAWDSRSDGPSIDLDEVLKLPILALFTYTNELTALLGKPFCVKHESFDLERREHDEWFTDTSYYFSVSFG